MLRCGSPLFQENPLELAGGWKVPGQPVVSSGFQLHPPASVKFYGTRSVGLDTVGHNCQQLAEQLALGRADGAAAKAKKEIPFTNKALGHGWAKVWMEECIAINHAASEYLWKLLLGAFGLCISIFHALLSARSTCLVWSMT